MPRRSGIASPIAVRVAVLAVVLGVASGAGVPSPAAAQLPGHAPATADVGTSSAAAELHRTRLVTGDRDGPLGFRTPWVDGYTDAACRGRWLAGLRLAVGYGEHRGQRAFAADSDGAPRSIPVADRQGATGAVRAALGLEGRAAVTVALRGPDTRWGRAEASSPELSELAVATRVGPFHAWIGRRAVGYGLGSGGGIVLSGTVPLDAVGLGSRSPGRLPGRAARAGEWSFEGLVGRMGTNGEVGRPWFLAGRGVWAPGRGVEAGFSRGAFFGGDGAPGLTTRRVVSLLFGAHHREEEGVVQMTNQTASFDLSVRGRAGSWGWLAFGELGFEDSSGAWKRSPAVALGVEAVPGGRDLRIGLERQYFSGLNGHGKWYRHGFYRSGWSDRGRPLGHPLAGHGTEWHMHMTMHGWDDSGAGRGSFVRAGLRMRELGDDHSFAPQLEGRSAGGRLELEAERGRSRVGAAVDADLRRGGPATLSASAWVAVEASVRGAGRER